LRRGRIKVGVSSPLLGPPPISSPSFGGGGDKEEGED